MINLIPVPLKGAFLLKIRTVVQIVAAETGFGAGLLQRENHLLASSLCLLFAHLLVARFGSHVI